MIFLLEHLKICRRCRKECIIVADQIVFNKNWGGGIDIKYNSERNSFDIIFSIDARGNYGTGYIDLNTNEFIRELKIIERVE